MSNETADIDTANRGMVSARGSRIIIANPAAIRGDMSADEAMALAAWLVAMASMYSTRPFQDFYDAVCST